MVSKEKKLYEVDLYKPIQKFFSKLGYEVQGEVHHCDVVALKNDELIVVELKLSLTVDLLMQATKRQKLTDQVYIAIPKPKYKMNSKKWHDLCHLLKRLELGLIVVSFLKSGPKMEICFSPQPFNKQRNKNYHVRKRKKLIEEMMGRNVNYNVGGSSKTKIMTAYKENCIQIASLLERNGPMTPRALRQQGTGEKTLSILSKNYYGWFEKVNRGVYTISDVGKKELGNFPEVVNHFLVAEAKHNEKH
ncbi:DUF2161 domain-containing phosphodiesterase [Robertmurraya sp. FSL R5-0851]|uniref:DUF2161 domain-containing phosphodiesterase n=1 Tax=Robertmurraya sp. FSL R5-0851 TaxID=2921584 RepID=UPI00092B6533|nr:Uncharacterized conserved protein [Mycobacteroides abscessus subsp. abscessus]